MQRASIHKDFGKIEKINIEEMREVKSLDVLLPAKDKTIRLRVVSTPSKELKVLLQRMKILMPNRAKIIENVVKKIA